MNFLSYPFKVSEPFIITYSISFDVSYWIQYTPLNLFFGFPIKIKRPVSLDPVTAPNGLL